MRREGTGRKVEGDSPRVDIIVHNGREHDLSKESSEVSSVVKYWVSRAVFFVSSMNVSVFYSVERSQVRLCRLGEYGLILVR